MKKYVSLLVVFVLCIMGCQQTSNVTFKEIKDADVYQLGYSYRDERYPDKNMSAWYGIGTDEIYDQMKDYSYEEVIEREKQLAHEVIAVYESYRKLAGDNQLKETLQEPAESKLEIMFKLPSNKIVYLYEGGASKVVESDKRTIYEPIDSLGTVLNTFIANVAKLNEE